MPLPFVLIGIGLLTSCFGAKKGCDAYSDTKKASELNKEAEKVYLSAEKDLLKQKESTKAILEALGKCKLQIWDSSMNRFVQLFKTLKDVELEGEVPCGFSLKRFDLQQLKEITDIAFHASEVARGGFVGLTAGALVGVASYGGAMMFASASTGTAIASLSGVAATNATLAWFGGGALSAGGLGIAGGIYVLGGLVAGPVLAAGGAVFAAKARQKVAAAKSNLAEANKAAQEAKNVISALKGISAVADQYRNAITSLNERMSKVLEEFEKFLKPKVRRQKLIFYLKKIIFFVTITLIFRRRNDKMVSWNALQEAERKIAHLSVLFAQVMKILLETSMLTKDGALKVDCGKPIEQANKFLLSVK